MPTSPFTRVLPCLLLLTAACTPPPPANPMEKRARLAAGAELAAKRCAGYAGGYDGAKQMRADANRNIATARELGATDEDLEKARRAVRTSFETTAAFLSTQEACNKLVSSVAWESG